MLLMISGGSVERRSCSVLVFDFLNFFLEILPVVLRAGGAVGALGSGAFVELSSKSLAFDPRVEPEGAMLTAGLNYWMRGAQKFVESRKR